jgi:hypothetical protein
MSCLPGYLYSSTTRRSSHAITYVLFSILAPVSLHFCHENGSYPLSFQSPSMIIPLTRRLAPQQTQAIAPTSASTVETNLHAGKSLSLLIHVSISLNLICSSDLLSRHVNKCHANEKPPQCATNGRRKGSASTSRATTSKQACDQCVQSSLPCDGCNPCCTFAPQNPRFSSHIYST